MKTIFVAVTVLLLVCVPTWAQAVIWSDDFESGNFSNWFPGNFGLWRTTTETAHSGQFSADIYGRSAGFEQGDELMGQISLAGYHNISLKYWYKVRESIELDEDIIRVEISNNNIDWEQLVAYEGLQAETVWRPETLLLPVASDDNSNFTLRLTAVMDSSGDRMHFDDFILTGIPIPEPASLGLMSFGFLGLVRRRRQ